MTLMKAAQVAEPGADLKMVQVEVPEPSDRGVLIKVEACGVCHGDAIPSQGTFPGLSYPRVPGHEVVGRSPGVDLASPAGEQARGSAWVGAAATA